MKHEVLRITRIVLAEDERMWGTTWSGGIDAAVLRVRVTVEDVTLGSGAELERQIIVAAIQGVKKKLIRNSRELKPTLCHQQTG